MKFFLFKIQQNKTRCFSSSRLPRLEFSSFSELLRLSWVCLSRVSFLSDFVCVPWNAPSQEPVRMDQKNPLPNAIKFDFSDKKINIIAKECRRMYSVGPVMYVCMYGIIVKSTAVECECVSYKKLFSPRFCYPSRVIYLLLLGTTTSGICRSIWHLYFHVLSFTIIFSFRKKKLYINNYTECHISCI